MSARNSKLARQLRLMQRQSHNKATALSDLGFHLNASSVLVDDLANEGEAEANPLVLAFVAVLRELVEFFPDVVHLIGWNSGSVVADAQGCGGLVCLQLNMNPVCCEFSGIGEEVVQQAL